MSVTLRNVVNVRPARRDEILPARRLQGMRYLQEGYVDHLSPDGTIDDRYVEHSEYFVAIDPDTGDLVGTCRIITSDTHSFPLLDHMRLDEQWCHTLHRVRSTDLAEVSALATERGRSDHFLISGALCRAVIQHALIETPRKYLLCVVDQRLLRVLNRAFGLGLLPVGPLQQYMGDTLPAVLPLEHLVPQLLARDDAAARFFLEGMEDVVATSGLVVPEVIDLRDDAETPTPNDQVIGIRTPG